MNVYFSLQLICEHKQRVKMHSESKCCGGGDSIG